MPQPTIKVKAVVFDMDGVITNTMPDHLRSWARVLKDEKIHVDCYDVYRREGQRGLQTLREIFPQNGRRFNVAQAKWILKKKEELFKRIVKVRFIPGAKGFVKQLSKSGVRLALVTGTSRHEMRRILPVKLRGLFDVIITGSDVKHGKPHPEPYKKALKRLGLKAAEAVVLENAPFGITSAKKAGLCCIALETSLPGKYLKEADYVFPTLRDCRARVKFKRDT